MHSERVCVWLTEKKEGVLICLLKLECMYRKCAAAVFVCCMHRFRTMHGLVAMHPFSVQYLIFNVSLSGF